MTDSDRFERYLDAFGARLSGAAAQAPTRRLRPALLVLVLCGGAVATIAVAIVLGATRDRFDPVAEAQAALASPGEIVYMKITSEVISPSAATVPAPRTTEQWSALDPLRWRFVERIPRPSARLGGMADSQGPIFGRREHSYGRGARRDYLAERDTLTVTTGYSDRDPAARIPSPLGRGSGDPQDDLRSLLADGEVRDEGEQQIGGRTVRRFVSVRQRTAPEQLMRLVFDVDPVTFAPLKATVSLSFHGDRPRVVTHARVEAYKRIALNDNTERLLQIQTTPQTKISRHTAEELRERARRWRAKCRPSQLGLSCPPPGKPPKIP